MEERIQDRVAHNTVYDIDLLFIPQLYAAVCFRACKSASSVGKSYATVQ